MTTLVSHAVPSRRATIPPGSMTAEQIAGSPQTLPPGVPAWLPWALEQAPRYLPAFAAAASGPVAAVRTGGPWPHIVLLWIAVAAMIVAGAMHMVGDGTLRSQLEATAGKVDRTDCDVRWLVRRALAEDRGQPVPPYSPEDCESR